MFFVLGIFRYQQSEAMILNNDLKEYIDGKNHTVIGLVINEPDQRISNTKLTIKVEKIIDGKEVFKADSKVLITTSKYPEYQYGDELEIRGPLGLAEEFATYSQEKDLLDWSYQEYLGQKEIYAVMFYPDIKLISQNKGNIVYAGILKVKKELRTIVEKNLPQPHASVLEAILLGDQNKIPNDWKNRFNYSGLRHLTAVSGMHVVVLTAICMSLLIGLGFFRRTAFILTLVFITLFVVMTGLQASAVRAGIMGGLLILAQYLGRMASSSISLVLAATVMLLLNPLLLRLDFGFQLSFLATVGIIYLFPIFQHWLRRIPDTFQIRSILAVTLAAQVFTLPISIYNFGYISLVSPFSNILAVPLSNFILGLGFFSALIAFVFPPVAIIAFLPVWFLMQCLLLIAQFFSGLPFSLYLLKFSFSWLLVSYFVLALATRNLYSKIKTPRFLK